MKGFIRFIGNSALNGQQVALYQNGTDFTLKAETVSGGKVLHDFESPLGKGRIVVTDTHLTKTELEQLEGQWDQGQIGLDSAVTVQRALAYMASVAVDRYVG